MNDEAALWATRLHLSPNEARNYLSRLQRAGLSPEQRARICEQLATVPGVDVPAAVRAVLVAVGNGKTELLVTLEGRERVRVEWG